MDKSPTFLQKSFNVVMSFLNDSGDTPEQFNNLAKKDREKITKNKEQGSKTKLVLSYLIFLVPFFFVLIQYYSFVRRGNDAAAACVLLMLLGGNMMFVSFVSRIFPYAILFIRKVNRAIALCFFFVCIYSVAELNFNRISAEFLVSIVEIAVICVAAVLLDKSITKTAITSGLLDSKQDQYARSKSLSKVKKVIINSMVASVILLALASFIKPDFVHFSYNYVKAKKGNAAAAYNLGVYYEKYSEDHSQSFHWYKQAAKLEYHNAFSKLADYYIQGKSVVKNYKEALNYLTKQDCFNNSECELAKFIRLGDILSEGGFGLEIDYDYAYFYYRQAFSLDENITTAFKLARLHEQQGGNHRAKKWYLNAAELGSATAEYELGRYFYTRAYFQSAHKHWLSADRLKHPLAKSRLSELYLHGYYVKQDLVKAQQFATNSLTDNEAFSLYVLGTAQLYRIENADTKASISKALQYLTKAFEKESPEAALQLGYLYYSDEKIERNSIKAIEYFTYARKKKLGTASYYLAKIYEDGIGIPQNYSKAFQYYLEAEKNKIKDAGFKVGLYYDLGISVERSEEKANEYYFYAASNSHYLANLHLAINRHQELLSAENKNYESMLFSSLKKDDYASRNEWYQHIRAYESLVIYLQRAHQYGIEKAGSVTPIVAQILYNTAILYADKSIHDKNIPGFRDTNNNLKRAERACLEAANANFPLAQYALATWYKNGHLGYVDHEKSAYWLNKAKESGMEQPVDITIDSTKYIDG